MVLKNGDKIHVIHRQIHPGDARRHFLGTVEECDGTLARVAGYLFAVDAKSNHFLKRDSLRTRIIPLGSAGAIINVLPSEVQIEKVAYLHRAGGGDVVVTDGLTWSLDITHL